MNEDDPGKSVLTEQAKTVFASARTASRTWGSLAPAKRAACIGALMRECVRSRDEIVGTVCAESGKMPAEALQSDLLPTLETLRYLAKHAANLLRPRRAHTPLIFRASTSRVEYRPRGVVLVIAPWNNPFQLSLIPVATALAAGNAVVLKPSERAPETGRLLGELCRRAGLPSDVLQIVTGDPAVAKALVEERPDLIFFTGGVRNGRSVLTAAARHLIPVILELGGKDPMVVFADANLDRAARAAVYGAFAHAGQHCVSVKRLYVERSVYDAFLGRVAAETAALAATPDWGRLVDEGARAVAAEQVAEALAEGARLLAPADKERAGAEPSVVADATPGMRLMQEETFAPVLTAMSFNSEDDAVRLANDSPFGLNASVWSRDLDRASSVVDRLHTGNAYVNNVLINVGNPNLPFGGVKSSGIGRYHGPEGLRAFCAETSVMVSRSTAGTEPNWFPHGASKQAMLEDLIDLRYGGQGWLRLLWGWIRLLRRL